MNACELTAAVTAAANAFACKLSDDELGLWAAVATQFGDTLATIAVQRALCEKNCTVKSDLVTDTSDVDE